MDWVHDVVSAFKIWWPVLVISLLLSRLLINKYGKGLHSIPGPLLASFTDLWRFWNALVATPHDTHIQLHQKHSLVRIGPRAISVSDPDLIPTIYGLNSGFTKTKFYTLSMLPYEGEVTPSLFTTLDEKYHATFKKPIANAYAMSTMVEFEPRVDSTSALFASRLNEFVASGEVCDLGKWLQMYAFDVIGEISFSTKLGFLETKSDVGGTMAGIRAWVRLSSSIGQIPEIDRYLTKSRLFLRFAPTHPVVTFAVTKIKERVLDMAAGKPIEERDFLARCFEAQEKYPDLITEQIIRMYNIDNIFAGSETTASSLRAILYYLMKNPESMQKVLTEIDSAESRGELSEFVTWKESNTLTYLQACIKEANRMLPGVGLLLERHVPKGGVTLDGHFIPEGTIVGVNPWVSARNKDVYGEDVHIFRPERWLKASQADAVAMDRANLAFGHGNRSCIGKNISMLEIAKLIPQLLRQYTFTFPTPKHQWNIRGGWLVGQDNFMVHVSKRQRQSSAGV